MDRNSPEAAPVSGWIRGIPAGAVLLAMMGCAATGGVPNITKEVYGGKPPKQSIVFGRLDVRNPKELGIRMPRIYAGHRFTMTRTSPADADGENLFHRLERSGDFAILLDPGEYVITEALGQVETLSRTGEVIFNTWLPFTVPEDGAVYIGAIEIEYTLTLFNKIKDIRVSVADDYENTLIRFRERYPFVTKDVENRTIRTEP